jgi:hypothetical protein
MATAQYTENIESVKTRLLQWPEMLAFPAGKPRGIRLAFPFGGRNAVGPDRQRLNRIKQDIRIFLDRNPGACDTLEGIGMFWVPRATVAELRSALKQLLSEGLLVERTIGNQTHYMRGPGRSSRRDHKPAC